MSQDNKRRQGGNETWPYTMEPRTPLGPKWLSWLLRCPYLKGKIVYTWDSVKCPDSWTRYPFRISSNSDRPRIVAAQSKALEQNKHHPRIVAAANAAHAHVYELFLTTVTKLVLGPFLLLLYESFPRLTAGLRGCAYYWQHLATVTVSLVCTLSSLRWCLQTFRRNKRHPQIHKHVVAALK